MTETEQDHRIAAIEGHLASMETKFDTKLDALADRQITLLVAALATLGTVTLALMVLLLTHALSVP